MKLVRIVPLVLSACAGILAALHFAPGIDKFATIHDAVIGNVETAQHAVDGSLALGCLAVALTGVLVAWSRRAWAGLAWVVATAVALRWYVEAHLFDGMFDDRIQHTRWGALVAQPFALVLFFGLAGFGAYCLVRTSIDAVRALRTDAAVSL